MEKSVICSVVYEQFEMGESLILYSKLFAFVKVYLNRHTARVSLVCLKRD